MYVITYCLLGGKGGFESYYGDVAGFTEEVLSKGLSLLQPAIRSYLHYLSNDMGEQSNTQEEGILELLIMGILWRVYTGDAVGLENIPCNMLTSLSQMRRNNMLKPGINILKGIMSTLFLSPDLYDNMTFMPPSLENFNKLLLWLKATGEFTQEVKRLEKWCNYLHTLTVEQAADIISASITFAVWFDVKSEESLGGYTQQVDRYLNEVRPKRYWHEDVIFCGRRRVEYHMNMVGAEIMNRIFREAFVQTSRKVILLPTCMRILPASKCKAVSCGNGFKCTGCSTECQVNQVSVMGRRCGAEVVIIPHESSISANKGNDVLFDKNTGVIGVACVLNLISGGWMLKEKGIPAQCVLLDYCGCQNHWHDEGMPTGININKLEELMDWRQR